MTTLLAHKTSTPGRCDKPDPGFKTCLECRKAGAERARKQLADRIARFAADPTIQPHGFANTYSNWGCRCTPCADAHFKKQVRLGIRSAGAHRHGRRYPSGVKPEPFGREWIQA